MHVIGLVCLMCSSLLLVYGIYLVNALLEA
jgi:hypothetical protein